MKDPIKNRTAPEVAPSAGNGLDRRSFIQMVGGGIVISFSLGDAVLQAQQRSDSRFPTDFNAYLRIGEDGHITCFVGKIEMGQGIINGLAQMCADELDLPFERVEMVMGDTGLCPWDFMTVGSRTTRDTGPRLRRAVAEARAVLLELAAEALNMPIAALDTADGHVIERANPANRIPYEALTKGTLIERHLTGEPPVESIGEHEVCGKEFPRTDGRVKVTGEALYAGDIRLPGMMFARILRPPAHGSTLLTVDTAAAEAIPGALIVRDGELVAVLHERSDVAAAALELITARWQEPESDLTPETIHSHLMGVAPEGRVILDRGDIALGASGAKTVIERTWYHGYVAHAAIETHTALADVRADQATLWVSTQAPFSVRDQIAELLNLPADKVRIITPFVGGGFGGKSGAPQAAEAARLSRRAGCPVQVAWTREEEFFHDTFMPAAAVRIRSGIDAAGKIVFWDAEHFFCGDRSSAPCYDIPHARVAIRGTWSAGGSAHPFGVGAWRGPGSNTNNFARESQVDLMAAAAGMDEVEFRRHNIADPRMRRVLDAAVEKFGWKPAVSPAGRGHGVACENYLGTYVATIAEVAVDHKSGVVNVRRMVCAQDMGEMINPLGAHAQIRGGLTMGLGFALSEEVDFAGRAVRTGNFHEYEIPRFSTAPSIETIIIDNRVDPATGGGEPAITTAGAVIAGAVHDALGAELPRLPLTPARITAAIVGIGSR